MLQWPAVYTALCIRPCVLHGSTTTSTASQTDGSPHPHTRRTRARKTKDTTSRRRGQDGTSCLAPGRMFGVRQRLCGTPHAIAGLCSIDHTRRLPASAEPRTRAWQQNWYQTGGGRCVCGGGSTRTGPWALHAARAANRPPALGGVPLAACHGSSSTAEAPGIGNGQ